MSTKIQGGKATEIVVGSIVRVVHPGWRFTGLQGFVVELTEDGNEDGPIGVRFPTWNKFLFDYPQKPDAIVRFQAEDLEIDERFDVVLLGDYLERLFGNMAVWVSYSPKLPLVPGDTDCMHEGCERKAYFEIFMNMWGTVCGYHVCGEHAQYHGICNDDGMPCKK